jgi:2'-5' RNA ligase
VNDKERQGDAATRRRSEKDSAADPPRVAASPRRRVPSLRVFCAVELPAEVRAGAAAHAARVRERFSEVRASWPRAENLHLTLKFLGEIEEARVALLSAAAARAAEKSQAFELTIEGAGAFPPRGAPRVLWLGIRDDSGGLAQLQSRLEDECARSGFKREERPFQPHLTLARLRAPQGARALAQFHQEAGFEAAQFRVAELVVMMSELGPGGSRYTEISRHKLGMAD